MSDTDDDSVTHGGGVGRYMKIIRAMEPGLLISINNHTERSNYPSTGQLRVTDGEWNDRILVEDTNGDTYKLGKNRNGDVALEVYNDDGSPGRELTVQTIEVLGVD